MAHQEIKDRIKKISGISSSYKIGKSGNTTAERLAGYAEFKRIAVVRTSQDAKVIDDLEQAMVKHFMSSPKCKNLRVDDVPMAKSNAYILYVVYVKKQKKKK